jgi:hypothetical protein
MPKRQDPRSSATPRMEASPLSASAITQSQREAGDKALQLLADIVRRADCAWRDDDNSFLPRIRHDYFNTTVLIDGERGVGKTALLVSLVDAMVRAFRIRGMPNPRDAARAPTRASSRNAQGETDAEPCVAREEGLDAHAEWPPAFSVDNVPRALVPVGILDLQPLPPATHLLLHILSRFKPLVDELQPDGVSEPAMWESEAAKPSVAQDFRSLLVAAAAGWNVKHESKSRYGGMDIETYAAELEEEAHERLQVVVLFQGFIESLASAFTKRKRLEGLPVFVLAIDDADLEPELSRQLIPLLRLLMHPRLALLLAGNSFLFEQTIIADWSKFYKDAWGPREQESNTQWQHRASLARDLYDKSVPQAHRCAVKPTLAQEDLEKLESRHPGLLGAFYDLPLDRTDGGAGPTESLLREVPLLAAALPGRIRELLDEGDLIAREIQTWRDSGTPVDSARVTELLARRAIASAAPRDVVRSIRYDVRKAAVELRGDAAGPQLQGFGEVTLPPAGADLDTPISVSLCPDVFDWAEPDPGWRRMEVAYVLAAWIGAHQRSPLFTRGTIGGSEGRDGLFAAGRVRIGTNLLYTIYWPAPANWPHSDVAAKALRWRQWMDKQRPSLGTALNVQTATRVLHAYLTLWRRGTIPRAASDQGLLEFGELAAPVDVANVCAPFRQLVGPLNSWVLETALLAAPEYGLPADAANAWLDAYMADASRNVLGAWKGTAGKLHEARRRYLGLALESAGAPAGPQACDDEVKRLDETSSAYTWAMRVTRVAADSTPPPTGGATGGT